MASKFGAPARGRPLPSPGGSSPAPVAAGGALNHAGVPRIGRSPGLVGERKATAPTTDWVIPSYERAIQQAKDQGFTLCVDGDAFKKLSTKSEMSTTDFECYIYDRFLPQLAHNLTWKLSDGWPLAQLMKDQVKTVWVVPTSERAANLEATMKAVEPEWELRRFETELELIPSAKELVVHVRADRVYEMQNWGVSIFDWMEQHLKAPSGPEKTPTLPSSSPLYKWEYRHLNPKGLSAIEQSNMVPAYNHDLVRNAIRQAIPNLEVYSDLGSFHNKDFAYDIGPYCENVRHGFTYWFSGEGRSRLSSFLPIFTIELANPTTGPLKALVLSGADGPKSDELDRRGLNFVDDFCPEYHADDKVWQFYVRNTYALTYSPEPMKLAALSIPFYPAPPGSSRPDALLGWNLAGMQVQSEIDELFERIDQEWKGWFQRKVLPPLDQLKKAGIDTEVDWQSLITNIPIEKDYYGRPAPRPFDIFFFNVVANGALAIAEVLATLAPALKSRLKRFVVRGNPRLSPAGGVPSYSKLFKFFFEAGAFRIEVIPRSIGEIDAFIRKPVVDFLPDLLQEAGGAASTSGAAEEEEIDLDAMLAELNASVAKPASPSPKPTPASAPPTRGSPFARGAGAPPRGGSPAAGPSKPAPVATSSTAPAPAVSSGGGDCHAAVIRFHRMRSAGINTAILANFTRVALNAGFALSAQLERHAYNNFSPNFTYVFLGAGGTSAATLQQAWARVTKQHGFEEDRDEFNLHFPSLPARGLLPSSGAGPAPATNATVFICQFWFEESAEPINEMAALFSFAVGNGFLLQEHTFAPADSFSPLSTFIFIHPGAGVPLAKAQEALSTTCKHLGLDPKKHCFETSFA